MNYDQIKTLTLSYSDREDNEVIDNIDNFILIAESRINRALKVAEMSVRATLTIIPGQEYYGLPPDFDALRDIEIYTSDTSSRCTLKYMSPEQLNNRASIGSNASSQVYYTLVAQQIQLQPVPDDGTLEIIYYQKLPNLNATDTTNWLSESDPDTYVFGILVEISSFVKDAKAADLWNGRFKESLKEIHTEDAESRWSGTALEVRVG